MSKYQLENSPIYIEGTDVPKNKLGVTDSLIIHEIEDSLLADAYEYFITHLTPQISLDEAYFIALHKKTFESLYDFAGVYRNVNMTKGNSQFCLAQYLNNESRRIFTELKDDAYLAHIKDRDFFIKKLAYYKGELIALHPFYELNGRILRLFIDMLCIYNGYNPLDYSKAIKNNEYIQASIECVQYADTTKLASIIALGLTTQ